MTRLFRSAGTFIVGRGTFAASAQTLLISIAILGVNVLTGVITARFLGSAGRGEQEAMGLWAQFLAYTFTLGLPSALVYNLKKTPDHASKILSAAFLSAFVASILAIAVGFIVVPIWLDQHSQDVINGAKALMFFAPAILLTDIFASALRARGDFVLYNSVRIFRPLATLIALLVLGISGRLTSFTACLCYSAPSLPVSVWLLSRVWSAYRPSWKGLRPAFSSLASYGIRSYGIDLLGTLSLQIDKVLVVGLLNASSMGLYTVSLSLANMLGVIQGAAVTVLFPQASGLSKDEAVTLSGRTARFTTTLTVVSALFLGVFGPWILETLYGSEFRGAADLMRLLIIVTVLEGTASVLAQAFMATNRPGLVTIRQGLGLLLNLPLLLILVPRLGLIGAGISLVITSFVRLIFTIVSFPQVLKVPPPRLWLNLADFRDLRTRFQNFWSKSPRQP